MGKRRCRTIPNKSRESSARHQPAAQQVVVNEVLKSSQNEIGGEIPSNSPFRNRFHEWRG